MLTGFRLPVQVRRRSRWRTSCVRDPSEDSDLDNRRGVCRSECSVRFWRRTKVKLKLLVGFILGHKMA